MKISYIQKYKNDTPAIVKLWFGKRYFIWKFFDVELDLPQWIEMLGQAKPTDEYLGLLTQFLKGSNIKAVEVEVVYASVKGELLLTKEVALLKKASLDPISLNQKKEPERPAWVNRLLSPRARALGFFKMKGRHRDAPAVVKLHVGSKYFIWKCKSAKKFEDKLNEAIRLKLSSGYKNDDAFAALMNYILHNNITSGTIEVVEKFKLTHVNRLMNLEKRLLYEGVSKSKCLNRSRKIKIPEWIKEMISKPTRSFTMKE
jgi:hypothetical protein